MSKKLAAILVTALAFVVGSPIGSNAQMQGAAAPTVEPGTKLSFPATLAGFQLIGSMASTAEGGHGTNYVYRYVTPEKMQLTVSIFDDGRRIPNGSTNPLILQQFTNESNAIQQQAKSGGYTDFEKQTIASACPYGSVTFRCITFSAAGPSGRLYGKLLLAGYRDNFLRIRIDWSQAAGHSASAAEQALASFIGALVH